MKYAEVVYAERRETLPEEALGEPEGRVHCDPRSRRTCGSRPCGCLLVDDTDVMSYTTWSESL